MTTSSMVLFLAVASNVFGAIFARLGSASVITNALAALPVPPFVTLLLVMAPDLPARLALRVAGHHLRVPADLLPGGRGVEVRHALVRRAGGGQPPDGVPLAARRDVRLLPEAGRARSGAWARSIAGMADFMVIQVIGLILCIVFPEIILWFPRWLFDRP